MSLLLLNTTAVTEVEGQSIGISTTASNSSKIVNIISSSIGLAATAVVAVCITLSSGASAGVSKVTGVSSNVFEGIGSSSNIFRRFNIRNCEGLVNQ